MTPYYSDEWVTLYHGRCEDVLPTLDHADLILTDPPYNAVNRDDFGLRELDRGEADGAVVDVAWLSSEIARVARTAYVFCATEQVSQLRRGMVAAGMSTRLGVWHKTNPSPMNGEYMWLSAVEACVFGRRSGATFNLHCQHPVWVGPSEPRDDHPTAKPEWLFRRLVLASTNPGDLVVDPYAGSGTTLRVCADEGRRVVGVELSERYCEIAAKRLAQGTLDLFGAAS